MREVQDFYDPLVGQESPPSPKGHFARKMKNNIGGSPNEQGQDRPQRHKLNFIKNSSGITINVGKSDTAIVKQGANSPPVDCEQNRWMGVMADRFQ